MANVFQKWKEYFPKSHRNLIVVASKFLILELGTQIFIKSTVLTKDFDIELKLELHSG